MNRNAAITAQNLTKLYKLYEKPTDRLKESLHPMGKKYHTDFFAVHDVSFSVQQGETLGIVGKNGSGKSTILKMITGVLTPSSGSIQVNGKISALLELGAGFNPDYTGLENIYLNGTIMGYTKEEMDQKLDDILSFADIGDFVRQPVKIYSSGMFVRLAFAVAINVDPEILIIDEALSVGDMRFQQKCFRKIEEFRDNKTILFVSHDLTVINKYCNRAIWLSEGRMMTDGTPKEVSKKYQADMLGSTLTKYGNQDTRLIETTENVEVRPEAIRELDPKLDVFGDSTARIIGIALFDNLSGQSTSIVEPGQKVKLIIKVKANHSVMFPIVGFSLKDRLGSIVTQTNSFVLEGQIQSLQEEQTYSFCFDFVFPSINYGWYSISPAIASGTQEDHTQLCWVHDALLIQVMPLNHYRLSGLVVMDAVSFYTLD